MFSCEFYEIYKNTFFTEHPRWLIRSSEAENMFYIKRKASLNLQKNIWAWVSLI